MQRSFELFFAAVLSIGMLFSTPISATPLAVPQSTFSLFKQWKHLTQIPPQQPSLFRARADIASVFQQKRPLVAAHRGYSAKYPENTMLAFRKAYSISDMIEFDVRWTSDQKLVVFHSKSAKRTTNGEGKIYRKDLAEMQQLDAGNSKQFKSQYQGARVPTLDEVLDEVGLYKAVNIEIKPLPGHATKAMNKAYIDQIIEAVKSRRMEESVLFSSLSHYYLKRLRKKVPEARLSLVIHRFHNPLAFLDLAKQLKLYSVAPQFGTLKPKVVQQFSANGIHIIPYTINKVDDMQRLLDMGVRGMFTNHPNLLSTLVR